MSYSLPYIVFILVLLLLALLQTAVPLTEKSQRCLSILSIVLFILFIGGRGFIGWDWTNYYRDFINAVPLKDFTSHKWTFNEPGWNIYISFFFTITDLVGLHGQAAYNFLVFFSTLIDALLLYAFLKHSVTHKYFVFALAVFFVFYGFTLETDLMRNVKGLLIFLYSLRYIESREWLKHYLLFALALTFHWSIIVLAPCYFFIHRRMPLLVVLALFVVGNIIYLFGLPSVSLIIRQVAHFMPEEMQERVLNYVDNAIFSRVYGFTLGYIERTIAFLLVLFVQHRMISDDKRLLIYINAMTIFVLICLYGYEFDIFITRFGALFSFGCWVMYPMLLKYLDRVAAPVFAILISTVIVIKMHNLSNNILYDYENFLVQKTHTYEQRKYVFDLYQDELKRKR